MYMSYQCCPPATISTQESIVTVDTACLTNICIVVVVVVIVVVVVVMMKLSECMGNGTGTIRITDQRK